MISSECKGCFTVLPAGTELSNLIMQGCRRLRRLSSRFMDGGGETLRPCLGISAVLNLCIIPRKARIYPLHALQQIV